MQTKFDANAPKMANHKGNIDGEIELNSSRPL